MEQAYVGYRLGSKRTWRNKVGVILRGWTTEALDPDCIPKVSRRSSEALSSTPNEDQERGNSPPALQSNGVGVNRMPTGSGIVSEANACGKAAGYADGDTAT